MQAVQVSPKKGKKKKKKDSGEAGVKEAGPDPDSSSSSDEDDDDTYVVSAQSELPFATTFRCYGSVCGPAERRAEQRYWQRVRLRPYPFSRTGDEMERGGGSSGARGGTCCS